MLNGIRLLVVDDDELLRIALASLLEVAGANVLEAPDAEEAVSCLSAGPVDLLLSDIQLPGESGIWLAEWVAAHLPALPVVLMSASLPPSGAVLPAPVRHFVRKPFDPDALRDILLQAHRAAPPGP
jgi:CheY-like chemotaxis protein